MERGGEEEGIEKHWEKIKEKAVKELRKSWLRDKRGVGIGRLKRRKEPKGAMQSNNTNTVSVWLLNLAKENRLPLFLRVPKGGTNWQELCPSVIL